MIPITSIMTDNVIYAKESMPVYEAMLLLSRNKISGLPVVDDDMGVKGVLSEKDVLGILIDNNAKEIDTVSQYMSRDVVSFEESADAMDICKFFMNHHIRRVPIVREGKLVGVVSRRDILDLILEARSKMSDNRFN